MSGSTGEARQGGEVQDQGGAEPGLDAGTRARLDALLEEGFEIWHRFDLEVRTKNFHPFVAADYERVLLALMPLRGEGVRFLEWGSATGVVTIIADMLGFEAYGIELDGQLVGVARELAARHGSGARFAAGSFMPMGYRFRPRDGDGRTATIGHGESAYLELGLALDDFDLVYGYPWSGEAPVMLDLMQKHGDPRGRLLLYSGSQGVQIYPGGREPR